MVNVNHSHNEPFHVKPEDVLGEFPAGSISITTRVIAPQSDEEVPTVFIEGDAASLRFLAQLILAQAGFPLDCGYGIAPRGPGSILFSSESEVGIYIHRLPCMDTDNDRGDKDASHSS